MSNSLNFRSVLLFTNTNLTLNSQNNLKPFCLVPSFYHSGRSWAPNKKVGEYSWVSSLILSWWISTQVKKFVGIQTACIGYDQYIYTKFSTCMQVEQTSSGRLICWYKTTVYSFGTKFKTDTFWKEYGKKCSPWPATAL